MAIGTGVEVLIGTGDSAYRRNIGEYNVVEDSTPLDPSDNTGGFGQINLSGLPESDIKRQMGKELSLTDGALGETKGVIRALSGNGHVASVTANSRLGNLAVERTIQPFIGTLTDCLEYHFGLCGVTTGIVIDPAFDAINVQVPGGRENVHDRLRKLAASHDFEISLVSNNVVVRKPRQVTAINYRNTSIEWTMDQSQFAQTISGYYYNTYSGNHPVYPIQSDVDSADVYQVDARETKIYEVVLDASLSSVEQPVPTTSVGRHDMSASVYTVATMDGVTLATADWLGAGGKVEVSLSEDTKVLSVTITGANLPDLSPFRIAMPDGSGGFFSSLRVRGTGVHWRKEEMSLVLNDSQDQAPDEVGAVVDVPFMETQDQLYHRLLFTAERYGTDAQTIRVTTGGINRLGEAGSARYGTIGNMQTAYPGATIGSIFPLTGPTIADWNAKALALVSGDFANQAFGNVNGARVIIDNSYYRIRTATIRPRSITYSAERNNVIGDVYRTGETIGQWNTRWNGKTIRDVNIAPLITEEAL